MSVFVVAELETLESQLDLMKEDIARYKKAARLWKARYKQERTARYGWLKVDMTCSCCLQAGCGGEG